MKSNYNDWIEYLNPDNLKGNLIGASLFISIYESLTDYLEDQLKHFYNPGFDRDGIIIDPKYKSEVLELDKNVVNASLKWFLKNNAITDEEYLRFHELRKFRNKLVHEMMEALFEGLTSNFDTNFEDLINLRMKIERWWVLEIEIPTNPDYDGTSQVNHEEILTGSQILFKLIGDLLSEDEKTANYYREYFIRYKNT